MMLRRTFSTTATSSAPPTMPCSQKSGAVAGTPERNVSSPLASWATSRIASSRSSAALLMRATVRRHGPRGNDVAIRVSAR